MATVLISAFCRALHSNDSSPAKGVLFHELTNLRSLILDGISRRAADIPMPTIHRFQASGNLASLIQEDINSATANIRRNPFTVHRFLQLSLRGAARVNNRLSGFLSI